jgi:hypothetical protein
MNLLMDTLNRKSWKVGTKSSLLKESPIFATSNTCVSDMENLNKTLKPRKKEIEKEVILLYSRQ